MQTLTLVRGMPGSGKTTFAGGLRGDRIAADDYFTVNGEYRLDASEIKDAHTFCRTRCRVALSDGRDVIVHNTFSTRWEMEPYVRMAATSGARLVVVDLYDAGCTDAELHARNIHGVPLEVIEKMRARWEHDWKAGNPIPPWQR